MKGENHNRLSFSDIDYLCHLNFSDYVQYLSTAYNTVLFYVRHTYVRTYLQILLLLHS